MAEYIERKAALKLIKSEYIEDLIAEWYEAEFDNVYVISKKEFLDIPAADVRPVVRGKWIPAPEKGDCIYHCSQCDYEIDSYLCEAKNFCPNCGADMRETN